MTSSYYGSTISRSQQSFLIGGGHLHYRAMEERYGLTFCSRVQQCTGKSHANFSLSDLQDRGLLRSARNFATEVQEGGF